VALVNDGELAKSVYAKLNPLVERALCTSRALRSYGSECALPRWIGQVVMPLWGCRRTSQRYWIARPSLKPPPNNARRRRHRRRLSPGSQRKSRRPTACRSRRSTSCGGSIFRLPSAATGSGRRARAEGRSAV